MQSIKTNVATSDVPQDIRDAEQEVEVRKAELRRSLHDAGRSGERMARRIGAEAKPVLIGAAVVVGAAAIVGVALSVSRSRKRSIWQAPQRSSALGVLARSAGLWLLRMAARRVVQEVANKLSDPALGSASAHPRSVAAAPNQI